MLRIVNSASAPPLSRPPRLRVGSVQHLHEDAELAASFEPFAAVDDDLAVDIGALGGQQIGGEVGELAMRAGADCPEGKNT
jgi:hypothetical protein